LAVSDEVCGKGRAQYGPLGECGRRLHERSRPSTSSTNTSTMPRDPITGHRRECTEEERVRIFELRSAGHFYEDIANLLEMSESGVRKVCKDRVTNHRIKPPPRSGPSLRLSDRSRRYLARLSEAHPRATLAEITAESRLNIAPRTAGKYLRKANLWVRLARRKPWLDTNDRRRRKTWSRERRKWDKARWQRKIIYTDEVKVQVGCGVESRRRVRRRKGREAAFDTKYLQPTFVGEPLGVSFWAAIGYESHTPLIPMHQRTEEERTSPKDKLGFNSQQYVDEILVKHLKPFYEKCGGLDQGLETVEDGAPYHTSMYTTRHRLQLGMRKMPWPAHSPDLNPIENVWSLFKARYRKAVWKRQRIPKTREELITLAQEVWENLPWKKAYQCIDSMPERVASCIKRGGGPTRW